MTSKKMNGTGYSSTGPPSTINAQKSAPFSDIIIPPSDDYSAYLEPTSSRPHSTTSQNTQQRHSGKIPTQHDSGVVEDLQPDLNESVSTGLSHLSPASQSRATPPVFQPNLTITRSPPRTSTGLSNIAELEMPRGMKRPDSLAVKGHDYEELPTSRHDMLSNYSEVDLDPHQHSMSGGRVLPPMLHTLQPPAAPPSVHMTDSNDNLLNSFPQLPPYRKRQNPLYDSSEHEDDKNARLRDNVKHDHRKCGCLWWTILFVMLIISLVGLCLSLYNFTLDQEEKRENGGKTAMVISASNRTLDEVLVRLQILEENNQHLLNKIKTLEENVTIQQNSNNIQADISAKIVQIESEFVSMKNNYSLSVQDLSSRINNIQLLPGPEGPAGAGNLSLCTHNQLSVGNANTELATYTPTIPSSLAQKKEMVILGIECTTDGGLYSNLIMESYTDPGTSEEYKRFKCKCTGIDPNKALRFCELYYWQCPRVT